VFGNARQFNPNFSYLEAPTFLVPKAEQLWRKIFLTLSMAMTFWQNHAKIWCLAQKLQATPASTISPEMLVKHSYIFCTIYFILVPLPIAQIGWLNFPQGVLFKYCPPLVSCIRKGWKCLPTSSVSCRCNL
jgi:hypothetical protein